MRFASATFLFVFFLTNAFGHDIITTKLTYTRDISRILARRCLECHSSSASIPLTNYEQVRPWAVSIKQQVLSRQMPPWGAVKGFGNLAPDNGLSQEELLIIASWVIGGSPQGNPALLPPAKATVQTPSPVAGQAVRDLMIINNRITLPSSVSITGIRPVVSGPIESARVVAKFPDGRIEPLVWLFDYDPNWKEVYHFRQPMSLPRGSTVEADSPLRFALETSQ